MLHEPAATAHDSRSPQGTGSVRPAVKVMSFNIRTDAGWPRNWHRRREKVAEILRTEHPDLAGLQEATLPMIRDLEERLPEYRWVGMGRDDGKERGEFNPIFFRSDRWEIQEHACFWLSAVCDLPGLGWDALCCRIVTWARLFDKVHGCHCVHFNTHLDHLGKNARAQSALLLLEKVQTIAGSEPVVITGDFNCPEGALPYRILTGQMEGPGDRSLHGPFRDTFHESLTPPEGPRKTYRGLMSLLGIGRIDYIFVKNGFEVRRHAVLSKVGNSSDHRPVVAELGFVAAND